MTHGPHDALRDVIVDLRDYPDLTNLLEDKTAITEGWPKDAQDYPAVVRVQPITESSSASHEHATIEKTYRMQVSVVVTQPWRDSQSAPTYRQAELMATVAERLDKAVEAPELMPDGTASSSWQDVSGDRVGLLQDWRITTYTR